MAEELVEHSAWDNRRRDLMPLEDMLDVIDNASTCVFIRLRSDGHPIGAVVGCGLLDGEIYTVTNVFRAAYRNIQRDPRCSVVFDQPQVASVTVIGRAEIVDDPAFLERFFRRLASRSWLVTSGKQTENEFLELAFTPNRRLFRIAAEKFFSSDQRTLAGTSQAPPPD